MSFVLQGQWGLNPDGIFQNDPWFLVEKSQIIETGFGKPAKGFKTIQIGEGVVLPGLVNAHTHLELSYLKNKNFPEGEGGGVHRFAASLMKRQRPPWQAILEEATSEIEKAMSRGTFYFSDISNNPDFIVLMKNLREKHPEGFRGTQFLELLGFCAPNDLKRIAQADSFFSGESSDAGGFTNEVFVTPHSIYASSPEIMRYVRENNKQMVSIHALEDPGELDLLHETGNTVAFLKSIGQFVSHPELVNQDYVAYIERYFKHVKKLLLVHLVWADEKLLSQIKSRLPQAAAVLCHRSNEFLGYKRINWEALANMGHNLLIGTDSTATSPDLSVLDEVLNIINMAGIPDSLVWKAAAFNAHRYFEIPQNEIPRFWFSGATPDLSTFEGVNAVNLLKLPNLKGA